MTPMPSFTASSASASPTRTLRSSDSTTHGPAMRNGLLSVANRSAMRAQRGRIDARQLLRMRQCRTDKAGEQRVRTHRPRLELGMELAADEPGVVGELDHLDERAIR